MWLMSKVLTTQDILVRCLKRPLAKHQNNIVKRIKKYGSFS